MTEEKFACHRVKKMCHPIPLWPPQGNSQLQRPPNQFGYQKQVGNIIFLSVNRTPLAVLCVYLRSSHLPSRTAVFLSMRVTPGEPSILTLGRTREFARLEGETDGGRIVARAKLYISGYQRPGGPW